MSKTLLPTGELTNAQFQIENVGYLVSFQYKLPSNKHAIFADKFVKSDFICIVSLVAKLWLKVN